MPFTANRKRPIQVKFFVDENALAVAKKKLSATLYSNRELRFARVLSFGFLNDYVCSNQFSDCEI